MISHVIAFNTPQIHQKVLKNPQNPLMRRGDMSRGLSPAELRICQMVFAFLAILILAFVAFDIIGSLFNSSPSVTKVQVQPEITSSTGRNRKQPSQSIIIEKDPPAGVVPGAGRASLSQMKAGLDALALQKSARFDPDPLDQRLDADHPVPTEAVSKPAATEILQPQWKGKVMTASASTEPPSMERYQEARLQPERRPSEPESAESSLGGESLTNEHMFSRLRDLGYLSTKNSDPIDASARDALRDFKLMNHLPNNDVWDLETSKKLDSQTAIRADQSIIGNWSTASCRAAKTTKATRLSITSRHAKSSTGSVCEFRDVQWSNHEWRVRANCSRGTQHWVANGKFALVANKLVWTSETDVVSYFRCR